MRPAGAAPGEAEGRAEAERPARPREGVFEVLELIRRRGIRFVELWFTEPLGRVRRVAIAAPQADAGLFAGGCTLDGPATGRAGAGLFTLVPDPLAAYPDPLAAVPTLALFCELRDGGTGACDRAVTRGSAASEALGAADPRGILRAAEESLRRNAGCDCRTGAEVEFFLEEGPGRRPVPEEGVWDFLRELAVALGQAGIEVDGFRWGPEPGQGRVQMRSARACRTADQVLLYKSVAAGLASRRGRTAVFAPRRRGGEGSAAMPVHLALWNGGVNLFHDEAGWARTSELCRTFAGGLLRHLGALLPFCAPTPGSFRRLAPSGVPAFDPFLSQTEERAACRVPARSASPAARRIKFRCADPSADPHLALAALILAGLDGVAKSIAPALARAGAAPPSSAPGAAPPSSSPGAAQALPLPGSAEEAREALAADADFLRRDGVFPERLLEAPCGTAPSS